MEFEKLLRVRTLTGQVVRFVIKAPRNLARLLCSTKQSFCDREPSKNRRSEFSTVHVLNFPGTELGGAVLKLRQKIQIRCLVFTFFVKAGAHLAISRCGPSRGQVAATIRLV